MSTSTTTTYAARLKALRVSKGWSQGQVARAAGVALGTIAAAEQGHIKRASPLVAERLAVVFGVDESVFTGTVAPTPVTPEAVAA